MKFFFLTDSNILPKIWRAVGARWGLQRTQGYYSPSSVCVASRWVGLLGGLLADVDEVARGLGLARDVSLEISVDAVLHFAVEGVIQQSCEVLQTMRVVGQTEFTGKDKRRMHALKFLQILNEGTFYCV